MGKPRDSIRDNLLNALDEQLSKLPTETLARLAQEGKDRLSHENIARLSRQHITLLNRIEEVLFQPIMKKVPITIIILGGLRIVSGLMLGSSPLTSFISLFSLLVLSLYLVFFNIYLIRNMFRSLLSAKSLWSLFGSYVVFVICILLLFSSGYSTVERMGAGYLTYGQYSDQFSTDMIMKDTMRSSHYFYFSAITFFTVGYGDICPMGLNKNLSMLNAFAGSFINAILMVVVVSVYLKRTTNGDS